MNAVIGMTDLALETRLTSEQKEYLGAVRDAGHSLLTLIDDILDFSKIEARKLDLESLDFNLRDTVENTIKMLALRAEPKGLELACFIRPEVPEKVVGDPGRLRQIILNLVGNAIKFTPRGEVVFRADVERRTVDQAFLHFTVMDTGIGIPRDKQSRIFEAFAQADSSVTRQFGGTGLGLAIASRLVELMGGRIWVESEVGKGSTFHFTALFRLQQADSTPAIQQKGVALKGLPALVVDDNATGRRILKDMLSNWHLNPVAVDGGEAALLALGRAAIKAKPFPLVLVDVHMPGMDGFTLARRIKQDPRFAATTIVMLTSAGRRGDAAHCRRLGIRAYLSKPIKQSDLWDAIVTALSPSWKEEPRTALVTRHLLREKSRAPRLLLAEDNPVNQKLAVRLLERQGYTVEVVNNGREALKALEEAGPGRFDLILMDVQMTEMGGFEATAAIREKEKASGAHIPIVAMTAHAMKGDCERCLAAGMDAYVSKPIQAQELFETIGTLVSTTTERLDFPQVLPMERLDEAALLAGLGGDTQLLSEVARLFLADSPELLAKMRKALKEREAGTLASFAHALRGSVGNFAVKGAFESAVSIERLARQGDLAGCRKVLATLEKQLRSLQRELNSFLKRVRLQKASQGVSGKPVEDSTKSNLHYAESKGGRAHRIGKRDNPRRSQS
jgi:two-component system, sensor histidine kinase and response regulator